MTLLSSLCCIFQKTVCAEKDPKTKKQKRKRKTKNQKSNCARRMINGDGHTHVGEVTRPFPFDCTKPSEGGFLLHFVGAHYEGQKEEGRAGAEAGHVV